MKYYIIAGEASGDLHGSNLMKGIYAEDPKADIRFWGGDCMNDVWKSHQDIEGLKAGADRGCQDRATPLAAGVVSGKQTAQWAFAASSHEVGGVVLKHTGSVPAAKLRDDPILNDQIRILQTLHMPHLLTFQLPHPRRQYPGKRTDIIYDSFHTHT